jgi:hypothetical protein
MKSYIFIALIFLGFGAAVAQPTYVVSPPAFTAEDEITISVNVSETSLAGYTGDVWMWAWIAEGCSSGCDAPSNVNPASAGAAAALMTRDEVNPDIYRITLVPSEFYKKAPSELKKMGFKLKSIDWADGKQTDSDVILSIDPLIFTPKVNRIFPTKVTKDDVVTLYLDQSVAASPALKYHLGDFLVTISAFDANGAQVGSVEDLTVVNAGNGLHYVRILPTYTFGISEIESIRYRFSSAVGDVNSDEFSFVFFK